MNNQYDTTRIPVIYGGAGELLSHRCKLLLFGTVSALFVVHLLVFAPIQTHSQTSSSSVSEERATLYLAPKLISHNSKFINDLEQNDPKLFLHPSVNQGFTTDLFHPDKNLTQSAVSIDFITDFDKNELTETPTISFSTSSIRLLNTDNLLLESVPAACPIFSSDAGVIDFQELALSSSDRRRLDREPPEAPTILRLTAVQDEIPMDVEVVRSCGVAQFDMIARNHLETQVNTDAFPKKFRKNGLIIRVLWAPGKFAIPLISEQDRIFFP